MIREVLRLVQLYTTTLLDLVCFTANSQQQDADMGNAAPASMAPLASSTSSSAATPDPYVDLFSSAPRVGPIAAAGALIPVLPLLRTSPFHDEPPLLCAAYKASCVGYSLPPRGTLSLASGAGGLGIGVPAGNYAQRTFARARRRSWGVYPAPRIACPRTCRSRRTASARPTHSSSASTRTLAASVASCRPAHIPRCPSSNRPRAVRRAVPSSPTSARARHWCL